ncbi:MAG: hypothetical protein EOP33_06425 [Rickettsiaceae bacterium]|nr:MAG: hypothetical protein EOP33_06425 [Rickettsiaceae bacterium]
MITKKDFHLKIKKDDIFVKDIAKNKQVLKKEYDYNYFESLEEFDDITIYNLINNRFGEKQFLKETDLEYILESKMKAVAFLISFRKACESGDEEKIVTLVGDLNLNHEELRSVINDVSIKMYQLACNQGYINSEETSALSMFEKYLKNNEIGKPENLIIHSSVAKSSNDAFKTLNECISAVRLALAKKNKGIFITCDISQTEAVDYLAGLGLSPAKNSNIGSTHQKNFDIAVIDWKKGTYRFLDIKFTNLNQMSGRYNGPFILHFGKLNDQSKIDSLREFIKKNALLDLNFFLQDYEGNDGIFFRK